MSGFVYLGILLLLALASPIFAFEEEPYNGVPREDDDGNDVGKFYDGPSMDESPRGPCRDPQGRPRPCHPPFRQGGTLGKGAQCGNSRQCSGKLNCCHPASLQTVQMQCWPCLGHNQSCQRQTDCISPLACSQKLDAHRQPIGRKRCIGFKYGGPPPYDEQIVRP